MSSPLFQVCYDGGATSIPSPPGVKVQTTGERIMANATNRPSKRQRMRNAAILSGQLVLKNSLGHDVPSYLGKLKVNPQVISDEKWSYVPNTARSIAQSESARLKGKRILPRKRLTIVPKVSPDANVKLDLAPPRVKVILMGPPKPQIIVTRREVSYNDAVRAKYALYL